MSDDDKLTVLAQDTSDLVFTEWDPIGTGLSFRIENLIEHVESPYQRIDLYQTRDHGKLLVNDGMVMLTERDEVAYHEMIVHVPLLTHPDPKRVLVIGGGDGGTLREIVKHPTVELARQVEIDEEVVRICRQHMPGVAAAYDDPKVDLVIGDGLKAVEEAEEGSYDVIIVDSTDPIGPAVPLFSAEFYGNIHRALSENGVMACQAASAFYHLDTLRDILNRLHGIYPMVRPFTSQIPAYPSGVWSFAIASKGPDPLRMEVDSERAAKMEVMCNYWNRDMHFASFALPTYARKVLEGE